MFKKKNGISRVLIMIMVVVTIFTINIERPKALHNGYTNYYGIEMTNDEYFTLLNLGFNDDEIYYMEEDEFLLNKDLDATLLATSNKYYKIVYPMYGASYVEEISELEYLQHSLGHLSEPLSTIYTAYIEETSTISQNGSKYRYKDTVYWLSTPDPRSYDVIAIGFTNSVFVNSNTYFNFKYGNSSGQQTTSTVYYGRTESQYGVSYVYKIPDILTSLTVKLYFDVSKNTNDTLTYLEFCGDYAHSLQTVTSSQASNHYVNSGGIIFDGSVYNYFNAIPCADAYASVNW